MKTDRELLELAARAAGIECDFCRPELGGCLVRTGQASGWWDPLADDRAALRLAVKLGLLVYVLSDAGFTAIRLPGEHIGGKYDVVEQFRGDPYTATRRAITMAAAQIGESMK